ncbi:MAG: hypothetical protein QOF57_2196, partial [Frankiaceae bacterium]|nr:hypothetical protein [Frankiaceae bacterium]
MTEHVTGQQAGGGERAGEGRRGSLRRPLTGRYVGGVAAGIARWFGLDPLLVRVAFVVLSVFGGSGFLLYALGWAIVPEDGAVDGPLRVWLTSRRRPYGLLRVAAYAALTVVSLLVLGFAYDVLVNRSYATSVNLPILGVRWLLGHGLQVGFLVAVTLVALSVLSHDRAGAAQQFAPARPATPTPPPAGSQSAFDPGVPVGAPVTASVGAPVDAPVGAPAGDAALVDRLRRSWLPRRRRARSPLGWLVLGLALAVTAVLTALNAAGSTHISGLRIAAVALLVLSIGLLIGAFAGWARWLVVVALALIVGMLPVAMTRGAAAGTFTDAAPSNFAQQPYWSVDRSRGTEIIDLTALKQPHVAEQREAVDDNGNPIPGAKPVTVYNDNGYVTVSMSAGKVILTTPATGNWSVSARTSFGTVTMPDQSKFRGFNAQSYFSYVSTDGGSYAAGPRSVAPRGEVSIQIYMS